MIIPLLCAIMQSHYSHMALLFSIPFLGKDWEKSAGHACFDRGHHHDNWLVFVEAGFFISHK